MSRKIVLIFMLLVPIAAWSDLPQVGLEPVPVVKNVTVNTLASYDSTTGNYQYTYVVFNPSQNTGSIGDLSIKMVASATYHPPSNSYLTIPTMRDGEFVNLSFGVIVTDAWDYLKLQNHEAIIPFGMRLPDQWLGGIDANGDADFSSIGSGYSTDIHPGQTMQNIILFSPGLPTLKQMTLRPDWEYISQGEASIDEQAKAAAVTQALNIYLPVLAPSAVRPGSADHWDEFRDDVSEADKLGWINDTNFFNAVTAQLAAARDVFNAKGSAYVTPALTTLLDTIKQSTPEQRNEEAYDLLLLNTEALLQSAAPPESAPPQKQVLPKYLFTTATAQTLSVNSLAVATIQVIDQGNNDTPMPGIFLLLWVEGVNSDVHTSGVTNSKGELTLTYTGKSLGKDIIHVGIPDPAGYIATQSQMSPPLPGVVVLPITSTIMWQGGPDLTMDYFEPSIIKWDGHRQIHMQDSTENIGNIAASQSVTRYYISTTKPVDPATAEVVTERTVPPLAPGARNDSGGGEFSLPSDLTPGTYFLTACANATRSVGETNYANNCQTSQVIMVAKQVPPPDCSHAAPDTTLLWPPNHKMKPIRINGITDAGNLPFTVAITGIEQDEPLDAQGDGHTEPDGAGIGTATAQVRAERSGTGQGRLYIIAFKATNDAGGICTGKVAVGVPHDKSKKGLPVDTGARYDSMTGQPRSD